jgi:hypothetical protein
LAHCLGYKTRTDYHNQVSDGIAGKNIPYRIVRLALTLSNLIYYELMTHNYHKHMAILSLSLAKNGVYSIS